MSISGFFGAHPDTSQRTFFQGWALGTPNQPLLRNNTLMPQTGTLSLVTSEKLWPEDQDPEIFYSSFLSVTLQTSLTPWLLRSANETSQYSWVGWKENPLRSLSRPTWGGFFLVQLTLTIHYCSLNWLLCETKRNSTSFHCHFAPLHLTSKGRHCTDSFTRHLRSQKQQVWGRALLQSSGS